MRQEEAPDFGRQEATSVSIILISRTRTETVRRQIPRKAAIRDQTPSKWVFDKWAG
jgi:hypothetical protein